MNHAEGHRSTRRQIHANRYMVLQDTLGNQRSSFPFFSGMGERIAMRSVNDAADLLLGRAMHFTGSVRHHHADGITGVSCRDTRDGSCRPRAGSPSGRPRLDRTLTSCAAQISPADALTCCATAARSAPLRMAIGCRRLFGFASECRRHRSGLRGIKSPDAVSQIRRYERVRSRACSSAHTAPRGSDQPSGAYSYCGLLFAVRT